MVKKSSKMKSFVIYGICACFLLSLIGCQSNTGTGVLVGAGLGQLIGGDTKATLIGAGIGAGAGYIIDKSKEKKAAQEKPVAQSYADSTPAPTPLAGTKWNVVSLVMENKPQYESITVEFRPDGIVETTRSEPGGTKTITQEKYRILENTLIIHKADYIVNATYSLHGNELIVNTEKFRAVLQRI